MKSIPDRWLQYKPLGRVIDNTKILAFKVPLKATVNNSLPPKERFSTSLLMEAVPNLKFVIDLTNTTRYYDKNELTSKDIGYRKIMCPGRQVPPYACVLRFFKAMDDFLSTAKNDDVIGIHCTHGLNRSGYFVCRYLVQQLGWEVDDAVKAFNEARGHSIERQVYIDHLKTVRRGEKIDTTAVDPTNVEIPSSSHKQQLGNRQKVTDKSSAPRPIEKWRDHPPIQPVEPARSVPVGERGRRYERLGRPSPVHREDGRDQRPRNAHSPQCLRRPNFWPRAPMDQLVSVPPLMQDWPNLGVRPPIAGPNQMPGTPNLGLMNLRPQFPAANMSIRDPMSGPNMGPRAPMSGPNHAAGGPMPWSTMGPRSPILGPRMGSRPPLIRCSIMQPRPGLMNGSEPILGPHMGPRPVTFGAPGPRVPMGRIRPPTFSTGSSARPLSHDRFPDKTKSNSRKMKLKSPNAYRKVPETLQDKDNY